MITLVWLSRIGGISHYKGTDFGESMCDTNPSLELFEARPYSLVCDVGRTSWLFFVVAGKYCKAPNFGVSLVMPSLSMARR